MVGIVSYLVQVSKLILYFQYLLFLNAYEFLVKIFFGHIPPNFIRIRKILLRYKINEAEVSRINDFLLTPGALCDLFELDHPNWHLYCIEENLATFVYLKHPITNYSVANCPFMFEVIHREAIHVAQIRHDDLIKLGKYFGRKPQPKTILTTNTARCASTLMAKMLHHPGTSICYAEPHALTNLSMMDNEKILGAETIETLLEATITCLRAHTPENEICVLKTTSGEARLVPYCSKISNLKHIFMFRKNGLKSVRRMTLRSEALNWCLFKLYLLNPSLSRFIGRLIAMEGEHIRKCKAEALLHSSALIYACPLSFYEKNKHLYCAPIIWHHDIINNTQETLESLFKLIDLPMDCVPAAVSCKSEDSQKDSFLSQDKLKEIEIPSLTEQDHHKLRSFTEILGIPKDIFEE